MPTQYVGKKKNKNKLYVQYAVYTRKAGNIVPRFSSSTESLGEIQLTPAGTSYYKPQLWSLLD